MNKKIKKKWLKALRGNSPQGVYSQGCHQLCQERKGEDYFCCLGVLLNETNGFKENQDLWGSLPDKAAQSAGLSYSIQDQLIEMNDEEGKSFKEIAKWVDKNL